jgi:hypothetical protein
VCFLTGLLLGPDPASRAWLSQWVRAGQKRRACAALAQLRQEQCCQLAEIWPLNKIKGGLLKTVTGDTNLMNATAVAQRGPKGSELRLKFGWFLSQGADPQPPFLYAREGR